MRRTGFDVAAVVDSSEPRTRSLYKHASRKYFNAERLRKVDRHNKALLRRINAAHAAAGETSRSLAKSGRVKFKSLNYDARKREISRINFENKLLLNRIEIGKPVYNVKSFMKDYREKNLRYKRNKEAARNVRNAGPSGTQKKKKKKKKNRLKRRSGSGVERAGMDEGTGSMNVSLSVNHLPDTRTLPRFRLDKLQFSSSVDDRPREHHSHNSKALSSSFSSLYKRTIVDRAVGVSTTKASRKPRLSPIKGSLGKTRSQRDEERKAIVRIGKSFDGVPGIVTAFPKGAKLVFEVYFAWVCHIFSPNDAHRVHITHYKFFARHVIALLQQSSKRLFR